MGNFLSLRPNREMDFRLGGWMYLDVFVCIHVIWLQTVSEVRWKCIVKDFGGRFTSQYCRDIVLPQCK